MSSLDSEFMGREFPWRVKDVKSLSCRKHMLLHWNNNHRNNKNPLHCVSEPNRLQDAARSLWKAMVPGWVPLSLRKGTRRMPRYFHEGIRRVDFHQRGSQMSRPGENKHLALQGGLKFLPCPGPLLPWPLRPIMHLSWSRDQGDRWLLTQTQTAQLLNYLFGGKARSYPAGVSV